MISTERSRRVHIRRIRTAARIGLGAAAICALPSGLPDSDTPTVAASAGPVPVTAAVPHRPPYLTESEVSRSLSRPRPTRRHHRHTAARPHRRHSIVHRTVPVTPPTGVWYRVAQCESGGDWQTNTGNGYYGGLQEDLTFWSDYGGLVFASRPDLASSSEQIVVARRGLAAQGPDAWPVCGPRAGLQRGD